MSKLLIWKDNERERLLTFVKNVCGVCTDVTSRRIYAFNGKANYSPFNLSSTNKTMPLRHSSS